MAITRNFKLFLNAGNEIPPVIHVNQSDEGETWIFTLYESKGSQYVPTSATLVGLNDDGTRFSVAGTIDGSGRAVIEQTSAITAVSGKTVCELRIDDDSHGTANFYLIIEESPAA